RQGRAPAPDGAELRGAGRGRRGRRDPRPRARGDRDARARPGPRGRGVTATLTPLRTPARPGPGPTPGALLRHLELTVRTRIDNRRAGASRSGAFGDGAELARVRPSELGDDVRRIDWNVTARPGEPHVRLHVAERAIETWLVLDPSASMTYGTADRRKWDV